MELQYDVDFFAWTQAQASALRAEKWELLDYANLAEEVESLGKRDQRELTSRLGVVVRHLLKWRYQPERRRSGRSWRSTIVEQRGRIDGVLEHSPSLQPQLPSMLEKEYSRILRRTEIETALPPDVLPSVCPWTLEQILDDEFWPAAVEEADVP